MLGNVCPTNNEITLHNTMSDNKEKHPRVLFSRLVCFTNLLFVESVARLVEADRERPSARSSDRLAENQAVRNGRC